jgi:hypothetical protein
LILGLRMDNRHPDLPIAPGILVHILYTGELHMKTLFLAGGIFVIAAAGIAQAQTTTSYSSTTTTVTPAPAMPAAPLVEAPPPGTLAVTHTQRDLSTDGSQTEKTYRNPVGVADESMTSTATPPVVETTTTRTSSSTTVIEQPPMPVSCPPHNRFDPQTESCVPQ